VVDDTDVDAWLRSELRMYVEDGPPAAALYGLITGDRDTAVGTGLHRLYAHDGNIVARSTDRARVVGALASHLAQYSMSADTSLGFFGGHTLVKDREAVVVPAHLWSQLPRLARVARKYGFTLADTPTVAVSADTGELVIPEPLLDETNVPTTRSLANRSVVDPVAAPGRYHIAGWLMGSELATPEEKPVLWDTWRILKRATGVRAMYAANVASTMAAAREVARSEPVVTCDVDDVSAIVEAALGCIATH